MYESIKLFCSSGDHPPLEYLAKFGDHPLSKYLAKFGDIQRMKV
jgi:hypothetical protein